VRLGIQHQDGNQSRGKEEDSTDDNKDNGPNWEERNNVNCSLLSSVGEVVVSGRHVVELSSDVHSDEATIEVLLCSVELHAVLDVLFDVVFVVVVLDKELFIGEAILLIQHGHSESQTLVFEERRSNLGNPVISGWNAGSKILDLDNVASVSLISSFSSISSWVGVTSGPLEVNVISDSSVENFRNEVVFNGRIGLDNVSSLSSDVQVEDSCDGRNSIRSGLDVEDVGSVLEGSSELTGIKGQLVWLSILHEDGIVLNRGGFCVGSCIDESSIGSVSVLTQISGRDVVSQSQDAVARVGLNARLAFLTRKSPVEVVLVTILSISKVVVSAPRSNDALRSFNSPGGLSLPDTSRKLHKQLGCWEQLQLRPCQCSSSCP